MNSTQLQKSITSGSNFVAVNAAVALSLDPFERPIEDYHLRHHRVPAIEGCDHTMCTLESEAKSKLLPEFTSFVAGKTLEFDRDARDDSHWGPASVWQIQALQKRQLEKKYAGPSAQSNTSRPPFSPNHAPLS